MSRPRRSPRMRYSPPALRLLALAAGTLTVLRVPVQGDVTTRELRGSTALYPLVGLGVGLVPALALLIPLPPLPGAVLALAAWVAVTGALHLDGWADCCDAAFAPARADAQATRERRLAILKDPHLGTFGAAGLVLLLLGKAAALSHLPWFAPLLAAPVARWCMVLSLSAHPPARPDGLAAAFSGRVPLAPATLALAAAAAVLLLLIPAPLLGWGVGAVIFGGLAGAAVAAVLARRFGGVTGDVCGAAGEAAELAALFALLPWSSL